MVQAQKSLGKKFEYMKDIAGIDLNKKEIILAKPTKKFSIIVPALNEEHTIRDLIVNIENEMKSLYSQNDFEIIVIDDGSNDFTFELVSNIKSIIVHRNERNMGKGYSMRKGIRHAQGKYIAFIDADGSHTVKDLIKGFKLIERLELYEIQERPFLITGVRFRNGNHGTTLLNKVGNKLYSLIGIILWHKDINDLTCGLRFAKKSDLVKFNLTSSRYTIEVEMMAECLRRKVTIIQMPIDALQRRYGTSGIRTMKEGIILPISFVLASMKIFSIITKRISI